MFGSGARYFVDIKTKKIFSTFSSPIETLTFVWYDATVDNADKEQPEDQHSQDSHPDAFPIHPARNESIAFRDERFEGNVFFSLNCNSVQERCRTVARFFLNAIPLDAQSLGIAVRRILTDTTARADAEGTAAD